MTIINSSEFQRNIEKYLDTALSETVFIRHEEDIFMLSGKYEIQVEDDLKEGL